jgi:predicted PolB exonuclease-like 3'-5' exonuclease
MLKLLADSVFSFDVEWIPDPKSAEILHQTDPVNEPGPDAQKSFEALWSSARKDGDPEDFQPYLKTILCRIVSLAGILREKSPGGGAELKLVSLPVDPADPTKCDEKALLVTFLKSVGRKKPQLVGYNSAQADVPIIVQRAIVNGLPGFGFSDRPDKPWLGVDYFDARNSEYNVDLADALGQYRDRPSLHQAATLSGIPGKIDVSGDSVAQMWAEGKLNEIVAYNEFDAFTTHLLWARVAHFSGLLSSEQYIAEQDLVRRLLKEEIEAGREHLEKFIVEWDRLLGLTGQIKSS